MTFSGEYDFSLPGTYSIQTDLSYTPDQAVFNNTLTTYVESWDAPHVDIGSGHDTLLADLPVILDAGSGYSSYLWQDLSTSQTYSVSGMGLYWVTVSDSHGCLGTDSVYVITETGSRPEEALGLVNIYPNPVKEILHVELEMPVVREVLIELYSMSNVLVYKSELKQPNATEAHIDVQGMAPGVYALKITADQRPHNFLVVVE